MSDTDLQLLARYTSDHAEDAFAEIVRRHLDLVYSAALRQVRSPQLAEEVAQSVFTDLARNASSLARGGDASSPGSLAPWLYAVTRRTAIDWIRKESRRQLREQIATEMNAMNATTADWTHVEPLLDEAMTALDDTDRAAVLLRYFENKSLREVGATLGTSDDAAQKRVSRAVERLREFFVKRGVTVGAGGLVAVISANAVQAAPTGLAATISTATALAGTAVASTSTVIAATKTIAMTTLQKTLIAATLTAAVGTGIYEARQTAQLRNQIQTLHQHQAEQIQELQHERDDAINRLANLSKSAQPKLSATPIQVAAQPAKKLPPTNLWGRFTDNPPKLTAGQIEAYLKTNGRKASSLLAAYRTSEKPALLKEAMEKYPNDPQVAFEAVLASDLSPEQKRQWLNTFEQAAPDNALANYLSAFNNFRAGQTPQAMQELTAAAGKQLDDYTLDRMQDDEEAYLSAGYSAAEAKRIADSSLLLSQLPQMKQLGQDLIAQADVYRQSGDPNAAQTSLQMAINLGQTLARDSSNAALISQLTGMAIEILALDAMNPNSPFGDNGQTVQDRLNQISQQRTEINAIVQQAKQLLPTLSDQDILNYESRRKLFGEVAALRWVVSNFGQQ